MSNKNKYNIAVLLPTRGRTALLERSITSLVQLAHDTAGLEFHFGFDQDDNTSLLYFTQTIRPWLEQQHVACSVRLFEPMGYGRLNEYVNTLARDAAADWLFFWNDDAVMDTAGWDQEIARYTGQFRLLSVRTHQDHPYSIFPIIPRAWYDQLGLISNHSMVDAFVSQIAYVLGIFERIPVHVTHDRFDITGNNPDSTYQNRQLLEGNPADPKDFNNPAQSDQRMKLADQLAQYMWSQGQDITWWTRSLAGSQDPWQQLKANDTNNQMFEFSVKDYVK